MLLCASSALLYLCDSVLLLLFSSALIYLCSYLPLLLITYAPIYLCSYLPLLLCTKASVGRRLSGRTRVSAYFKKWLRKLAEILPPASSPFVRRPPPYYFNEILAVCNRFKPKCSRVRPAARPRAARESWCRAAGLLAVILPIRGVTRLRFSAEFFKILGDFSMSFAKFSLNSGLKNSQRKLCSVLLLLLTSTPLYLCSSIFCTSDCIQSTCHPGKRETASWSPWRCPRRTAARTRGCSWSYRYTPPVPCLCFTYLSLSLSTLSTSSVATPTCSGRDLAKMRVLCRYIFIIASMNLKEKLLSELRQCSFTAP